MPIVAFWVLHRLDIDVDGMIRVLSDLLELQAIEKRGFAIFIIPHQENLVFDGCRSAKPFGES
jgi:hypothetical protein